MAVGEFTKECAQEALDTLLDMGKRLTKPKLREFFGHFNEIALFIEAAKRHAPEMLHGSPQAYG